MTEVPCDPTLVTEVTEDHRPIGQYALTLPCMKTALQLCALIFVSSVLFGQEPNNPQLPSTSVSLPLLARADVAEMAAPNAAVVVGTGSPTVEPAVAPVIPIEAPRAESSSSKKKVWYGLMAAEHSAAFFDAYTTRQVLSSGSGRELDPLVRPFAHSAALYPALQISPVVADYFAARMMHSNNRFLRKLWWVPQAAGIAGSTFSGINNVSNLR